MDPATYGNAALQRTCRHHSSPRHTFDAIWVTACNAIAAGSGRTASNTPARINPPAMPNRPDKKAVATMTAAKPAAISGVTSTAVGPGQAFAARDAARRSVPA